MTNIKKFLKESFRLKVVMALAMVSVLSVPAFAQAALLTRQLEQGMSGADVGDLQTFLAQDITIYPQGLVTSYFGPLTKSAVSNFQARNGIDTVGRVGPITLAAINAQMSNGRTTGFDRHAPVIGPINVNTTSSEATISWNTNEDAAAIIYYSNFPLVMSEASPSSAVTISGSTLLVHTDQRMTHIGTLTGLQSNTRYNYVVYVRDSAGNASVSIPLSFQTSN